MGRSPRYYLFSSYFDILFSEAVLDLKELAKKTHTDVRQQRITKITSVFGRRDCRTRLLN